MPYLKRKKSTHNTFLQRDLRGSSNQYNQDFEEEVVEVVEEVDNVLEEECLAKDVEAAAKKAEEERLAKEREEAAKKAEEERLAKEVEAAAKKAEEERLAKEREEAAKKAEEERLAKEAEEARRKAELEQMAKELEEQRRKAALEMETLQREQVTVQEAKEVVSDEVAEALIEIEEETEKIYGTKKGIINLDIISKHFNAGDVVTVNVLKEKKLIDKNICFIKVLARGVLDKPLTIKAQDFSIDAAKMIELTGGHVVMLTKRKYFN